MNHSVYVLGARVATDRFGSPLIHDGKAIKERPGSPLSVQKPGDVVWLRPKPVSYALHFRNAAAKLRAMANERAMNAGRVVAAPDIRFANPTDIVHVPVYAGIESRLANVLRARARRNADPTRRKAA